MQSNIKYPGVDVGSVHNPVVARIQVGLKKIVQIFIRKPNIKTLKNMSQ